MSSLLHMVPDPIVLLQECRRVLKPNGYLILSVPNHYQFVPRWLGFLRSLGLRRPLNLPESHGELVASLNKKFQVGGPLGYYKLGELNALLEQGGFVTDQHVYAPSRCASFLWELAVLGYLRLGNLAFHALFLLYPLGWIAERTCSSIEEGSEHIVRVCSKNEH